MTKRFGGGAWRGLAAVALLLLCVGAGVLVVRERSLHAELDLARAAFAAGNHALASARLSRLAERWTNDGEVFLLLGENELERARKEPPERRAEAMAWSRAALAALSKVPPASPHFSRASLLGATHLINTGHYAPAEEILNKALADPERSPRYELERALSRLDRFQGRFDEVREIVRGSWCRSPTPANVLKELWTLDHSPMPVEAWRRVLEAADGDDDRVWLGRANLAITTGRLEDAAPWLDRCAARRSEDTAVWQARLNLALAKGDPFGFWKAVPHLPADRFNAAQVLSLRAWLMALGHDEVSEARELAALVAVDPGNTRALERLAVLMASSGRVKEVEELRRRKAELARAHDKYQIMLHGDDLSSRAADLAELTAKLGRRFDSLAWSILAEAHLRDAGQAEAGSPSGNASPLVGPLAAKAVELSSPYTLMDEARPMSGPTLDDQLVAPPNPEDDVAAVIRSDGESAHGTLEFVDDAEPAGLRFAFDNGKTAQRLLPETMSGGVGLIDFDGDGWFDVYCVQGGALQPPAAGGSQVKPAQSDRLFRNRGDGTFTDVTDASGIARLVEHAGYGFGVAVGDYDNDGHSDLFVSRLRTYALYRNRGDGTFEDVTARAGLAGVRDNPTSAAFADLDNDGDLDLYVCHYLVWDPEHARLCLNGQGEHLYCGPTEVPPAPDHLFRNDGERFIDVTASSGCAETCGRGLGVVVADFDGDSLLDLFIANDGTANLLFRNLGGLRFEEVGQSSGTSANASGGYQAGMGVACGDWDGDGLIDLAVTNFYGESTTLFHNLGHGFFADQTTAAGLAVPSRYMLGFGAASLDADNDGHLDLMTANGHVNDLRPYFPYAMTAQLYRGGADGRLTDVTSLAGPPFQSPHVGRGLAVGDLDNDGRMDAVLVAQNEPMVYFHNRTEHSSGHFITFHLQGTTSNRDGVGASVAVTAGGRKQVAQRFGGGSYLSAGDPRLHFGLGAAGRIDRVEIRWPSGRVDLFENVPVDNGYRLIEGAQSLKSDPANAHSCRQIRCAPCGRSWSSFVANPTRQLGPLLPGIRSW